MCWKVLSTKWIERNLKTYVIIYMCVRRPIFSRKWTVISFLNCDDDKSKIMPNEIKVDYSLSFVVRAFKFTLLKVNWVKTCELNHLKCSLMSMKIHFLVTLFILRNHKSLIFYWPALHEYLEYLYILQYKVKHILAQFRR